MPGVELVAMVPHPPIIIPSVGGDESKKVSSTIDAMKELSRQVAELNPDTVIIVSPHGPVFRDAVAVFDGFTLEGDLGSFNAPSEGMEVEVDTAFVAVLEEQARESPAALLRLNKEESYLYTIQRKLDHGALVPMLFLREAGVKAKYVNITFGMYPYGDLYALGKLLHETALSLNRRGVVLASGDLSHCLIPGAPGGFRKEGKVFDETLVEIVKRGSLEDLFAMDKDLIEKAGECGFRSLIMALGALDGREFIPGVLSYQGPFGVGYLVASFLPTGEKGESLLSSLRDRREQEMNKKKQESFPAALARAALEAYVRGKGRIEYPRDIPEDFQGEAGVFVSIKKEGNLRGCIGTTESTTDSISQEIMQNAVSAGTRDPRFPPVSPRELDQLSYSVDILDDPREVKGLEDLDPAFYGVIVEAGRKRGLLLPDLPGVDSPQEQVRIAMEKAGIEKGERVKLYRFRVHRYY